MHRPLAILLVFLIGFIGCRHWLPPYSTPSPESTSSQPLPAARLKQNSVVLRIAVVEIQNAEVELFEKVWPLVDQQAVDLGQRRLLDQNGFRIAVVGPKLPAPLVELLKPAAVDLPESNSATDAEKTRMLAHRMRFVESQREQIQTNQEHWVGCSVHLPELVWSVVVDSTRREGICAEARCGFNISVEPRGDGSVGIWLKPEVQFGRRRHRFDVNDDSFMFGAGPERLSIVELDMEIRLRPGESLILAPSRRYHGLGQDFFVPDPSDGKQRFLLVRLVHTQHDDLFLSRPAQQPLATSTD